MLSASFCKCCLLLPDDAIIDAAELTVCQQMGLQLMFVSKDFNVKNIKARN